MTQAQEQTREQLEEQDWRGVAAEDVDELPERMSIVLRARSRRLLASLLRPHRRMLWFLVVVVLIQNGAAMLGPWLVGVGIDKGIPALVDGDWTPLLVIGGMLLAGGTLAAVGTHSQLLATVPEYRNLLAQESDLEEVAS